MKRKHIIKTKYRKIVSDIPHPDSLDLINRLGDLEPDSMHGFMPVIWDKAVGFQVSDPYGNTWIDFTSAVVLTNSGHANPRIGKALRRQLSSKMWHNYCNPSERRLEAVREIKSILPDYLDKVFLLTTGSEAVECALKLAKMHGSVIDPQKLDIISFYDSFHGRTMGSTLAGGYRQLPAWFGDKGAGYYRIPFPNCARCPWGREEYDSCGAECFQRCLKELTEQKCVFEKVAGILIETFQGPLLDFLPDDFALSLEKWARENNILIIFDEIQAGFGRTGKWFGFEHYNIKPDLVCMGKGMTSCLPMSAVAGRGRILDIPPHGEMSSTHTGNPLSCAALISNIGSIRDERMIGNAKELETVARAALGEIKKKYPDIIGAVMGKGLAWAVYIYKKGTRDFDVKLAERITTVCMENGLLMLQTMKGTLKIAPPLCISREAFIEGIGVIEAAVEKCSVDI